MTVLTRASDMGRKPGTGINNAAPVTHATPDTSETMIDITLDIERKKTACPRPRYARVAPLWLIRWRYIMVMLWVAVIIALLLLCSIMLGTIYRNQIDLANQPTYKGFCAIPIDAVFPRNQATAAPARMPLRWSEEPEITVFTNAEERFANEALNNLLERFDIDDNVEKISVYNSGHNVEFIHDFNANATGIVDQQRCFVMALDHETVLRPNVFVLSIQRGEPFDLMRVMTRARALLPPSLAAAAPAAPADVLPFSSIFMEKCADRPTYKLQKEEGNIRKRSTDETKPDYMHFAGKHVLEISIDNLPELLEFEKKQTA